MELISEPNYSITFNSNSKSKILKNSKQLAALATSSLGIVGLANKTKENNVEPEQTEEYSLTHREVLIQSKIQENIEKNKTISVKAIAKELNIPLHLVITSLYRTKSNIRNLFDKVKNTAYLRKPTSEANKNAAQEIINASKNYMTTYPKSIVDKSYIDQLGRKLNILNVSNDEINEFSNLFQMKPALTDIILFSRSKAKKSGLISPNTMKSIVAAHEINQELTEELLSGKKPSGQTFDPRDIYKIVKVNQMSEKLLEPAKEDTTFVYELATARMKNGKPRFGAEDILQIIKSIKKEPDFVQVIMQQKNGLEDFRFNGHQIRLILKTYEKYPNLVKYLLDAKYSISSTQAENKYSSFCIEKVLETLNGDDIYKIRMVKSLLDNRQISSSMILDMIEKYEDLHCQ